MFNKSLIPVFKWKVAKISYSLTTKERLHIESWDFHKEIKDINDDDNNNINNNKDDDDNNKDDNDKKVNSALELDRSQGFSRGHQGYQQQP